MGKDNEISIFKNLLQDLFGRQDFDKTGLYRQSKFLDSILTQQDKLEKELAQFDDDNFFHTATLNINKRKDKGIFSKQEELSYQRKTKALREREAQLLKNDATLSSSREAFVRSPSNHFRSRRLKQPMGFMESNIRRQSGIKTRLERKNTRIRVRQIEENKGIKFNPANMEAKLNLVDTLRNIIFNKKGKPADDESNSESNKKGPVDSDQVDSSSPGINTNPVQYPLGANDGNPPNGGRNSGGGGRRPDPEEGGGEDEIITIRAWAKKLMKGKISEALENVMDNKVRHLRPVAATVSAIAISVGHKYISVQEEKEIIILRQEVFQRLVKEAHLANDVAAVVRDIILEDACRSLPLKFNASEVIRRVQRKEELELIRARTRVNRQEVIDYLIQNGYIRAGFESQFMDERDYQVYLQRNPDRLDAEITEFVKKRQFEIAEKAVKEAFRQTGPLDKELEKQIHTIVKEVIDQSFSDIKTRSGVINPRVGRYDSMPEKPITKIEGRKLQSMNTQPFRDLSAQTQDRPVSKTTPGNNPTVPGTPIQSSL